MAAEPLAPLLDRKRLIKCAEESTNGTHHGTCTLIAANYYNVKCIPGAFLADGERKADGNYVGRTASVAGKRMGKLTYDFDVAPGGPLINLLTLCGYASGHPASDLSARKNWSYEVFEDGLKKSLTGCAGKIKLTFEDGKKLVANVDIDGIWDAVTDAAMPAQAPITAAPYVCRGLTLTMAAAAIAKIEKLELDLGPTVEPRLDITAASGIAHFLVTEILPVVTLDPEARKVADQDNYGLFLAGTTAALVASLVAATGTLGLSAPAAQRNNVGRENRGLIATHPLELQLCNSSGDDAVTISETT